MIPGTSFKPVVIFMLLASAVVTLSGQRVAILKDVRSIQVLPTMVINRDKVKEDFAPILMQDLLRGALRDSDFEIVDEAPIKALILLEEFSSGSKGKRWLTLGAGGRSTVAGRLVFRDAEGEELVNVRIKARGAALGSAYEGGETQRRKATGDFDQRLTEQIARLK